MNISVGPAEGRRFPDRRAVKRTASGQHPEKESAGKYVCTIIRPLEHLKAAGRDITRIEAELITGRSHQIRAQLADAGHVLVGDVKYASPAEKEFFIRQLKKRSQLLHCGRMVFPRLEGPLEGLSERTVQAGLPHAWDLS